MDLKQGLFTNFANFDDTIISKKKLSNFNRSCENINKRGGGEMECAWSAN